MAAVDTLLASAPFQFTAATTGAATGLYWAAAGPSLVPDCWRIELLRRGCLADSLALASTALALTHSLKISVCRNRVPVNWNAHGTLHTNKAR